MRVFVTGATGFIGTVLVADLIGAGHHVLGLARSDEGARKLIAAGAEVHRGDLADIDSLRTGAALADGVIHTAFNHNFSTFPENSNEDRRAIEAIGGVLAASDRPFVVTAGVPPTPDRPTTEEDAPTPGAGRTPRVSEETAMSMATRGVRASVVRVPQVHDRDKFGLVSYLIRHAREKGVSAYVGAGLNRWPAIHRLDVAPVYRLALEKGAAGARYHAVTEEGVTLREIAEAIGRGLKIPVASLASNDAVNHYGAWLGSLAIMDGPASSALTQQRLGWRPTGQPKLLDDIEHATTFEA